MLGVSKSTLRRLEGSALTPVIGPGNVHFFHEEEVRSIVVTRRSQVDARPRSGDIAAEAFTLFDAGIHVVDVVKQLHVDPEVVESLHARWARLRSMMLLSREGRSEICKTLIGWDDGGLKTEADVIAFLKKWIQNESMRTCLQCKGEFASFCRDCARKWGLEAAGWERGEKRARKL